MLTFPHLPLRQLIQVRGRQLYSKAARLVVLDYCKASRDDVFDNFKEIRACSRRSSTFSLMFSESDLTTLEDPPNIRCYVDGVKFVWGGDNGNTDDEEEERSQSTGKSKKRKGGKGKKKKTKPKKKGSKKK